MGLYKHKYMHTKTAEMLFSPSLCHIIFETTVKVESFGEQHVSMLD